MAGPQLVGYGPQIVGAAPWRWPNPHPIDQVRDLHSRPPAAPRLRPFVLKCPNCIAPLDATGANGRPTHCAFCKVPYVWEPALPIDRDDQAYRYEAPPVTPTSRANTIVRGLGPTLICGGATSVVSVEIREFFRPCALWVSRAYAENFAIADVRVGHGGHTSVKHGEELIPCSACAEGEGLDVFDGCTCAPGSVLSVRVVNLTAVNQNFHAIVRGVTIHVREHVLKQGR